VTDVSFPCMGTEMRLVVGAPLEAGLPAPAAAARSVRFFLEDFDARLSRFRVTSELSALNADPRRVVPASALLRSAVRAGIWAARHTGGLVDPTLVGALERAGYATSRAGVEPAPLREALAEEPRRMPASPHPARTWQAIHVDEVAGTISRPPGVRIDTGGAGKGLAADMAARMLRGYEGFVVDCGGDLRIGGRDANGEPFSVEVEHPITGRGAIRVPVHGGVATSGIHKRIWHSGRGLRHHLLDPATGQPAWTGIVSVTAMAPTVLEAETIAKAALLSGPAGARRWLAAHGGVLVHDGGEVEHVGLRVVAPPRVRFRLPERRAA
jgi:FAD:protein FMN transferase